MYLSSNLIVISFHGWFLVIGLCLYPTGTDFLTNIYVLILVKVLLKVFFSFQESIRLLKKLDGINGIGYVVGYDAVILFFVLVCTNSWIRVVISDRSVSVVYWM